MDDQRESPDEVRQILIDGFLFTVFYLFIDYCVLHIECSSK